MTDEVSQDGDWEEINSEEVDRVVESIEALLESVESETIRSYLEECMNNVYYLVYDDEEEDVAEAA